MLYIKDKSIRSELEKIQNDLFEIGGALAFPHKMPVETVYKRPKQFEELIDALTKKLPPLNNFILPGGGEAGAFLHLARTVCRRAERQIAGLSKKAHSTSSGQEKIDPEILVYLNRLSDLLFTMARFANHKERKKEKIWRKR